MAKQNTFKVRGNDAVIYCPDTHGTIHEVLVDTEQLTDIIALGFWRVYDRSKNPAKPLLYAFASCGSLGKIALHRYVTKALPRVLVDHRGHTTLDNRANNLRIASHSLNALNQRRTDRMCVYRRGNRFQVRIEINQVQKCIGSFISEQAAKDCRDEFLRTQGVQI